MSMILFANSRNVKSIPRHTLIQKMLEENSQLIQAIKYYQSRGRSVEVHQLLQVLHRSIILLGSIADELPSDKPENPINESGECVQNSSLCVSENESSQNQQNSSENH